IFLRGAVFSKQAKCPLVRDTFRNRWHQLAAWNTNILHSRGAGFLAVPIFAKKINLASWDSGPRRDYRPGVPRLRHADLCRFAWRGLLGGPVVGPDYGGERLLAAFSFRGDPRFA